MEREPRARRSAGPDRVGNLPVTTTADTRAAEAPVPRSARRDLGQLAIVARRQTLAVPLESAPPAVKSGGQPRRGPGDEQGTIEQWRAYSGFRIDVAPVNSPQPEHLARQAEVLGYLLALLAEHDWSIQFRLIAEPESPDGLLSLFLLCAAGGRTRRDAQRGARECAQAAVLAGDFLAPVYALQPLTDGKMLNRVLSPFRLRDVVELRRQSATVPAQGIPVPIPLPPRSGAGHWLCQALATAAVERNQPLLWAVTLEGAHDAAAMRGILGARLRRDEAPGGANDLGAIRDPQQNQPLTATERALELQWTVLGGLTGRVQALLAGNGEVPPAVIAAAIADCSDTGAANGITAPANAVRAARPRERELAADGLRTLQCRRWEEAYDEHLRSLQTELSSVAGSFTHLVDVTQAGSLFWFPVPGPAGLPGRYLAPRSPEIWLPTPPKRQVDSLYLGDNVVRQQRQPVFLNRQDRLRHVYTVGQTGVGKSTFLLSNILEDLEAGRGVAVLDPHGELIDQILAFLPPHRTQDLILIDPADRERPVGFNFLECEDETEWDQIVENFIGLCYQLFDPGRTGIIGPRFEHAVRNAILTVLPSQEMTLVDVVRVLTDIGFVNRLLPRVEDPLVRSYWLDQIAKTSDFHRSEVLDYIVSKFSRFVHNRLVRNIIGQSQSSFSLRRVMDEGKVLLVSLAQGKLGPQLSSFLGMILVPKILLTAFSRVNLPESERRPFMLYVDEFQNYASPAFVDILSGARKYGLSITMAHQHVAQLPTDVRSAVFGNVGTLVAFRVGLEDAALLTAGMQPSVFTAKDYIALPNFQAITQVLDAGKRSPAFTLATNPAPELNDRQRQWRAMMRNYARERYGRPRTEVEQEITRRAAL